MIFCLWHIRLKMPGFNFLFFSFLTFQELFLQLVSEKGLDETRKLKRKTLQYDDLSSAVQRHDEFEFLIGKHPLSFPSFPSSSSYQFIFSLGAADIVPQKISVKEAMQKSKN